MEQAELNNLTERIIGAAIEVHKILGPGLLESAYEHCLCHELELRGIEFERQVKLPIVYKGLQLDDSYRVDILVEKVVVIECKSVDKIEKVHKSQISTYLKIGNWKVGLLINFNVEWLKDGIVRRVNNL
ncbi:MAG: GxxExxY protein [Planctomycetes bacterium]|nr:GxxExxY protein [Planctomycetota bacterium]